MAVSQAGFPRSAPAGYIPGLNGLRALSVMLVIIAHAGFEKIPGSLGVTVFFFISGFLITGLLLREYDRHDRINIPAFYAVDTFG